MSGIWAQLGISATSDIREIKRAYAGKLKTVRPDEKPKEFQALHAAYQSALNYAKRDLACASEENASAVAMAMPEPAAASQAVGMAIEPEAEPVEATPTVAGASTPAQTEAADVAAQESAGPNAAELEWLRLLAEVDRVLADDRLRPVIANWQFLERTPYILDTAFCWHLGVEIFQRIENYYCRYPRIYANRCRTCPIMGYLDSLFEWRANEGYLRGRVDGRACDLLLPMIEDPAPVAAGQRALEVLRGAKSVRLVTKYRVAPLESGFFCNDYLRLLAVAIDAALTAALYQALLAVCRFFMREGTPGSSADSLAWIGLQNQLRDNQSLIILVALVIFSWLFECSKYQATPGMLLCGIKVMTKDFGRVGYLLGLWRNLVFGALVFGNSITLLINCFLKGRYLHDRASRTLVIDYRRSIKNSRRGPV